MAKRVSAAPVPPIRLDRGSAVPIHRQIFEGLRGFILEGRLSPGAQLPSTRTLAAEVGVSRSTVVSAYSQLLAEGYLEGRVGSGTYVSRSLPDDLLRVRTGRRDGYGHGGGGLSRRGEVLTSTSATVWRYRGGVRAFRPGVPAVEEFPFGVWSRLASRRWRNPPRELLAYGDPRGYRPLREAIAEHLGASRAVRCSPDQVVVVSGSQQGLDLAARVLLDPGDAVWVEDPGYDRARAALLGAGARVVPVPVDEEGLKVAAGEARAPDARLACVTPSHQYPSGVTMSLGRRMELLRWAQRSGAWIFEDDYDSEYRYSGRPLEALQGLDGAGRVVYVGTFSKVLLPSLRLGYLVVPPGVAGAFAGARELADRHSPSIEQAVLADFIAEGYFARHLRRMRTLYAKRQAVLVEAAEKELAGLLDVRPAEAGMHLVGWLAEGADDRKASLRASTQGVEAPSLSVHRIEASPSPGLVLGYAAVGEIEILRGVRRLAAALRCFS